MSAVRGGDALLGELQGLLARVDPVPAELLDQVRRSFCWRTIDAELAELSFDSLTDQESALAVRSGADAALEPRMLGFSAVVLGEELSIEVEISSSGDGCVLVGQVFPAGASAVEMQAGTGGSTEVPVDELGRFVIEPVPGGPVRLRVDHAGRVVQTTWVSYTPC
ncbi:MAG TPA: hypothetical protein VI357_02050 [Mycobacteriales bacterium]